MRRIGLVLTTLVLAALAPSVAVRAQQAQPMPPAQPKPSAAPANELDKKLDGFLQQWEKKMQEITSLKATLDRSEKDKTFKTEAKYTGFAEYLRVGQGDKAENKALLVMKTVGKKDEEFHEKIICTGPFIYQFSPPQQKIYVTEVPKPKAGQVNQDNFLTLVFGASSADMRARYDLRLSTDDPHPTGEDKYYIYVDVYPKTAADKADFLRAQLVLSHDTLLPRRLWFEATNKSEVLWDITEINDKAKLDRKDFDAPQPPTGWKLEQVDPNTPRTVRPNQ
jgi:TIGR03009 family protein